MGIDCVGLIIMAASDIGIQVPDMPGYRRSPDGPKFVEHIRASSVPASEPLPGTFGIFRDGSQPCHVGIFAEMHGGVSLIHAYAGTGQVMEEMFDHDWPKKLIAIQVLEGLT